MLKKNSKLLRTKIVSIVILVILISYICISPVMQRIAYASQTTESYSSKINNYSGYTQLIENLKSEAP